MRKTVLLALPILLIFWVVTLWTYSHTDPSFTSTGNLSSIQNFGGIFGAYLSNLSYVLFGLSCWWLIFFATYFLLKYLKNLIKGSKVTLSINKKFNNLLTILLLLIVSTTLEWSRFPFLDSTLPAGAGGILGKTIGTLGYLTLGTNGLFLGLLGVIGLVFCLSRLLEISWTNVAEKIGWQTERAFFWAKAKLDKFKDEQQGKINAIHREEEVKLSQTIAEAKHPTPILIEPKIKEVKPSKRFFDEKQQPLFNNITDNNLPRLDLLDPAKEHIAEIDAEYLNATSRLIESKLAEFNVDVRVISANPGPVITRYEIEPATGVKGSQIVNLSKDLARSLSKISIRVVETIPGKNLMAIELPNEKRQTIQLTEILQSEEFHRSKSKLTVALGKDIVGSPVVADLAKMPHVLVAGTTGSGKSVGINAMILSLLYKATPSEVRLLMIDPKMLEMAIYADIPHLIAPVVTDMTQAGHGLNWCVNEMERRYKIMSHFGVRNLAGFNQKILDAKHQNQPLTNPFSLTPEQPEPLETLPQIVIIVDEFADLMMVVGKKVEEQIARIAQKARAAGIHLILATQRPSVDVITGLIKANVPTRVAFQVSSKIDSRTILDQMGAENLLGMGDMLYLPSGTSNPTRVHGAFVSDEEVQRVVEFLKSQSEPNYIDGVLEPDLANSNMAGIGNGSASGEKDPMYDQAVQIVLSNNRASISLVQRHLSIGYNRAANILESMERAGIVSPMSSSGKREILVQNNAD